MKLTYGFGFMEVWVYARGTPVNAERAKESSAPRSGAVVTKASVGTNWHTRNFARVLDKRWNDTNEPFIHPPVTRSSRAVWVQICALEAM